MPTSMDKLMQAGCEREKKDKVCRSRGGESCAFDGAMIALQPIADSAHIIHGPIACCGNSWEGRGSLSSKGNLHRMGFTTDMSGMDIIYGSEEKLYKAVLQTYESVKPKAIFVYATCVSGLIGEDIEAVCKKAETATGIRVIPVNAPGFIGPKNLGNRIAGEVLLDHVIGTGEPPEGMTEKSLINLIGEYNIAGDLWLVEPVLKKAGIRVLSRMTGDSTFKEITYAHRAKLNVVVCSRALINVAREMEKKYGIPYVEVSFFGKTEMSKAMRLIASNFKSQISNLKFAEKIEAIIADEEKKLAERLQPYEHLRDKKAVLYTGGVKSWSFISALMDLGIEIVAIGTKKSTFEDEEKMKEILGQNAPLTEDTTPKNLLRLLKERNADMLIAGGRNQYLAIKEGYPFVDVNQERHTAYAGYDGLINLAEQISRGMRFYDCESEVGSRKSEAKKSEIVINPLKHSQSLGAAIALQGIDNALPIIHGAQGCSFLAKALMTKHFREPVALASTKLFTEDVVMGSEENITNVVKGFIEKNNPDVIGILTSGLSEVKGDDAGSAVKELQSEYPHCAILHVPTPDYEGGIESGYAKTVETLLGLVKKTGAKTETGRINILAGGHLTPADFTELREMIEAFGLKPIILPDLSALDGSRQGISPLSNGGTTIADIRAMGLSEFTIAIGASMKSAAEILKEKFGVEYKAFESIAGLRNADMLMETLSMLSGNEIPKKYERQRRILIDGMRDAHFYITGKKVCLALDHDLAAQTAAWLNEMGAEVVEANSEGGLFSITGEFDLLISNSHAEDTAKRLGAPLYQMGFPVYKILGNTHKITIGYKGTLGLINAIANLMMGAH
jgi:nitrogenase molybdenum-cofactor synthesis protein NifE